MSDRALFISWGTPVRGLEEHGLEVFNEALGMLGRMQQDGRIDGFDVCVLEPNGDLTGFVLVRGTADQIDALRRDDEFRRSTADSAMVVDRFRHISGYTNEAVAGEIAIYAEAIAKVPQRA